MFNKKMGKKIFCKQNGKKEKYEKKNETMVQISFITYTLR